MFQYVIKMCNVLLGVGEYAFALLSLVTFRVSFIATPDYWGFMKDLFIEAWDRIVSLISLGLVIPTLILLGASGILEKVDLDVWYEGDAELAELHRTTIMACNASVHWRIMAAVSLFVGVALSTLIAFFAMTIDLFFSILGMTFIVDED